jgi:hypothetical protein
VSSPGKSFCALLLSVVALYSIAASAGLQTPKQVTLNGVAFNVPEGYAPFLGEARENTAFFYNQKYKDGMVVAVPAAPFVEQDVLDSLLKESQKRFFPKETAAYQWKSTDLLRKVSKFEVRDALEKGLNRNHLLLFEFRHVVFNQRDVFVATIYEARKGKPATAMFADEGAAMSMTTCRAAVDLIYSVTGEKVDPERPPCELGAKVP